ncbi:hypothetical protein [Granulicella sp. S190]|uniref:hypothetical protein n=1 Tax=Granulicella sp. S190 TaxID=1747226 RepID=UPI00131D43D2|nr:hypothetical protein [Granulicella sp. S190]
MLEGFAKGAGLAAVGLVLMAGQGCKKKQAPVVVTPVVRTAPRAATPDFPDLPPPVPVVADREVHHAVRHVAAPPVMQAPRPVVDPAALAAAQRQSDAVLLQRQEAASQRQQQELNGVVQRSIKTQQDQQAEPRIQELPEVPISQPDASGQPRISDKIPGEDSPQQGVPPQDALPPQGDDQGQPAPPPPPPQ